MMCSTHLAVCLHQKDTIEIKFLLRVALGLTHPTTSSMMLIRYCGSMHCAL
jgi:hypothetical protein